MMHLWKRGLIYNRGMLDDRYYYLGKIARKRATGGRFNGWIYNEVSNTLPFILSIPELESECDSYAWARVFVMLHRGFVVGLKNGKVVEITDTQCPQKIESGEPNAKIEARFAYENKPTQISLRDIRWEVYSGGRSYANGREYCSGVYLEPEWGKIQEGHTKPLYTLSIHDLREILLGCVIAVALTMFSVLAIWYGW